MSELDCSGLSCPMPIFKLAKKMKEIPRDDVLIVISDDPAFVSDVEAWTKKTGNRLIELKQEGHKIVAQIKKESG